ncbi:MAG: PASTA domain-containing protein, partial [Clostridia bacterium]|nr:PASTA domain-containing protein [Clostridia bacterium]
IHRDIKQQNIMLLKNGKIKVTDFGIAKLPNAETVTMTDKAIGTVFYISPEQASGKKIDPRSDLYSLGVLMYEMSTGTLPFNAESPVSVALMQVSARPKPPREINPTIPQGLEQIILGAMEKVPEKRFQSAAQMLKLLTHIKNNPSYVFKTKKTDKAEQKNKLNPKNEEVNEQEEVIIKRRSRSMLPIIAGVMSAFLLVLGLSGAYLITKLMNPPVQTETKTVTVKYLLEHFYSEELKAELEAEGFNVLVTYEFNKDYSENTIIEQTPEGGERRKVNIGENQLCDLELVVSKGAEVLKLRDYTVSEYRVTKLELENMGIHVKVESDFHPTMMSGYIYRTEPAAGTTLVVGDTVTLYVSNGPEIAYTQVPNFKNMTEAEAMDTLIQYKLAIGKVTREYNDDVEKGRIISQSINPYTEVPQNETRIGFVVSLGKKGEDTTVPVETEPVETDENGVPAGI